MPRPAPTTVLLFLAAASAANAEPAPMTGQALRDLVPGAVVEIDTPLGTRIPVRYTSEGRISGEAGNLASYLGASSDTGRWWIDRDRLCHKWTRWFDSEPQCLGLRKDGRRIHWRNQDGQTGTATLVSRVETAAADPPGAPEAMSKGPASRAPVAEPPAARALAMNAAGALAAAAPSPPKPPPAQQRPSTRHGSSALYLGAQPPPDAEPAARPLPRPPVQAAPASGPPSQAPKPAPPPAVRAATKPPAASIAGPPAAPTYRVARVAQNDILNVRYGPSSDTAAVGAIAPDGRGVVISGPCQDQWCPIRHAAVEGWVNRSYLDSETEPPAPAHSSAAPGDRVVPDSPEAPRACLTAAARALLQRIEREFGPVRLVSTCRPGATIAGTGRPSRHASGNAIDFDAGSRRGQIVAWLIANHHDGGTMTYAGMDHIHADIGPRFVSLDSRSGRGGRRWSLARAGR